MASSFGSAGVAGCGGHRFDIRAGILEEDDAPTFHSAGIGEVSGRFDTEKTSAKGLGYLGEAAAVKIGLPCLEKLALVVGEEEVLISCVGTTMACSSDAGVGVVPWADSTGVPWASFNLASGMICIALLDTTVSGIKVRSPTR
jgi:hypothetical protein